MQSHLVVALSLPPPVGLRSRGRWAAGLTPLPAESRVEQMIQRQPLLAADDDGRPNQVISTMLARWYAGGQCVGRFVKHLVVERRGVHLYMAADQVVHFDGQFQGIRKADHPLVAVRAGFPSSAGAATASAASAIVGERRRAPRLRGAGRQLFGAVSACRRQHVTSWRRI